jgi:Ca-activated chloride channel family protein
LYKNGVFQGYKTDSQGNTVVTKLNEQILKEIASTTGGVYIKANKPGQALTQILDEIKNMEKKDIESGLYADFDDKFQWFMLPFIFIMILESLISNRRSHWIKKLKLFE